MGENNIIVGDMAESENRHIIPDFNSMKLIAGYDTIVAVTDPTMNDGQPDDIHYHVIGFLNSQNHTTGRPVQQIGELGSNALFTIIMEGQKSRTFNRMLVRKNILREMYYMHINNGTIPEGSEILNSNIWIDLDHSTFDIPINVMLYFFNNENDTDENVRKLIAKVLLKNALITNFVQPGRQGQRMIMESLSITWEETIEMLDVVVE